MNNLIGEIGAVLSPAVSGALRDATGREQRFTKEPRPARVRVGPV
jgi:hypothetical protein